MEYLKQIGMDLESKLTFEQFVDIIRNQKLFNYDKTKIEILEQDEKNKEDININNEQETVN